MSGGGKGKGKGTLLVKLRAFVEKQHGADAWDRLVQVMPPPDRELLTGLPLQNPCFGKDIDLDRVVSACAIQGSTNPPPPPASLRIALVPDPVSVRAGDEALFVVQMTNATRAPVTLDLTLGCVAFEANAYLEGKSEPADEVRECDVLAALCDQSQPVRITLEPGGSLTKKVTFAARIRRLRAVGDTCEWQPAGALGAAHYRLSVSLPFEDSASRQADPKQARIVEGALVVLPR